MPRPVASTLMSVTGADASEAKARKRMSAALVTNRPVRKAPAPWPPRGLGGVVLLPHPREDE